MSKKDWILRHRSKVRVRWYRGKRLAKLWVRDGGQKVVNWLRGSKTSKEWYERFRTKYRKHFSEKAGKPGKQHGVFDEKYRDPESLKELVRDAAKNPSHAPYYAADTRTPRKIIIERDFDKPIGYEARDKTPCSILHIVADTRGRVISVYPVVAFDSGMKGMFLVAVVFKVMEGVLAEEAQAADEFYHPCPTGVLDYLWPPLLEPTCGGTPVKPDQRLVDQRSADAINRMERELGFSMSVEERAEIRREVEAIWNSPLDDEPDDEE